MQDIIFWGTNYEKFLAEACVKSPKLVVVVAVDLSRVIGP